MLSSSGPPVILLRLLATLLARLSLVFFLRILLVARDSGAADSSVSNENFREEGSSFSYHECDTEIFAKLLEYSNLFVLYPSF